MASEAKHTPITHDEAREIARRLIHGSFRRDGEQLEHDKRPRFSIPANPDRDDDLRIRDYIEQQKAALAERDAALVAVEEAKNERDRLRLLLSRAHYELDIAEKHFRHPALPKDGLFGSRVNVLREDIRRELVGCPDPDVSSLPTAQVKG